MDAISNHLDLFYYYSHQKFHLPSKLLKVFTCLIRVQLVFMCFLFFIWTDRVARSHWNRANTRANEAHECFITFAVAISILSFGCHCCGITKYPFRESSQKKTHSEAIMLNDIPWDIDIEFRFQIILCVCTWGSMEGERTAEFAKQTIAQQTKHH